MEHPQELRELASWYRNRAELGNHADRDWRAGFAQYLEKHAAEIEHLQSCVEKRARMNQRAFANRRTGVMPFKLGRARDRAQWNLKQNPPRDGATIF